MDSIETPSGSVTGWVARLRGGDRAAFAEIWRRYAAALARSAQEHLPSRSNGLVDGEDVAQSVFLAVWRAAENGRFHAVDSRRELWWLLLAIAKRRVIDRFRHETALKRGAGAVVHESTLAGGDGRPWYSLDAIIGDTPSPDFLVTLEEQYRYLIGSLSDDVSRRIASERVEGYEVGEIAERLGIGKRTVERKLKLIRGRWSQHLDAVGHD